MKKILPVWVFVVLIFVSCSSTANLPYEPKAIEINENSTIVCFGDSLTYGHGADPETESWPALLQERVTIPVINSGKDDDTTADGLARFEIDVRAHNPAVLIIDFGGNDIYLPKKHQTYKQIEANFRQMLDQINFSKTQVFIMRFYNDEMHFLDFLGRFDKILTRLQKDYDVVIIWDAWKGAWGHKDCKYDMSHCNAKGYKIMEQNIFSVIEPCLEINGILK